MELWHPLTRAGGAGLEIIMVGKRLYVIELMFNITTIYGTYLRS